jgi:2-dehydro-3-deoxygluconokinase
MVSGFFRLSQKEAADTFKTLLPFVDICSCGVLDAVYILGIDQADHSLSKEDKLKLRLRIMDQEK